MSVLPLQGPLPALLGKRCHRLEQVSLSQGRRWIPAAPWAWTAEASPFHRCPPQMCPPGGGAHLSGLTALALALRRGWDGPLVAVVGEGRHELRLTGCGEECILGLRSPLCVRDGPWDRVSLCSPQGTVCVASEHPRRPLHAPPPTRGHATWKGLCQEPAPPSLGLEALCEAGPDTPTLDRKRTGQASNGARGLHGRLTQGLLLEVGALQAVSSCCPGEVASVLTGSWVPLRLVSLTPPSSTASGSSFQTTKCEWPAAVWGPETDGKLRMGSMTWVGREHPNWGWTCPCLGRGHLCGSVA